MVSSRSIHERTISRNQVALASKWRSDNLVYRLRSFHILSDESQLAPATPSVLQRNGSELEAHASLAFGQRVVVPVFCWPLYSDPGSGRRDRIHILYLRFTVAIVPYRTLCRMCPMCQNPLALPNSSFNKAVSGLYLFSKRLSESSTLPSASTAIMSTL